MIENIIGGFLAKVKPSDLKKMVINNTSLYQFAKNHPNAPSIFFWVRFGNMFIKVDSINTDKVIEYVRQNNPELLKVMTRSWLEAQLNEWKEHLR